MTREETINNAAVQFATQFIDTGETDFYGHFVKKQGLDHAEYRGFIAGAKWADKNPKSPWISVEDDLPSNHEEYRPFKDTDECWEEMKKHEPIGWLEHKSGDYKAFINSVNFADININNYYYTYEYAFDYFTFIDRTPFGIKEE